MVMVLPRGAYDYDVFPLVENIIEIDDDGNDVTREVFIDGVIEIDDAELGQIRITKRFADDLDSVIDMTEAEIAEEQFKREKTDAHSQLARFLGELLALDYLTNKRVEGKISDTRWGEIVERRDELRRRIKQLKVLTDGHC